jgi:hypothetical protein
MAKNSVKPTTIKKFKGERQTKMENEEMLDSVENKITNEKEMHYIDHDVEDDVDVEEDVLF